MNINQLSERPWHRAPGPGQRLWHVPRADQRWRWWRPSDFSVADPWKTWGISGMNWVIYIYIWCTISVIIILYMLYYITWEVVFCFLIIIICYGLEMVLWRWNNIIIILNSHEQGFIDGVWFVWCYMAYVVDLNGIVISTNSHLNRIKWGYIYIYTYNHWGLYLTMVMYWDMRDLYWTWRFRHLSYGEYSRDDL